MKQVFRLDRGSLRKPTRTPQGFLRVDGIASRAGIFEYPNGDGTTRRELRLPDEVFAQPALDGFEGAPLTDGHPSVPVTAANVKQYEVGTVTGPARRDGDLVAVSIVVKDPKVIAGLERGDTGLSVGYAVDLDETPGTHPQYGRYDAIQRNIVINHLAARVSPRAGNVARVRMDGVTVLEESFTPKFAIADRVRTLVDHGQIVKGSVGEVTTVRVGIPPYYGVTFKGLPEEHRWLAEDEIVSAIDALPMPKLDGNKPGVAANAVRIDQQIDRQRAAKEGTRMADKTDKQRADEAEASNAELKKEIARLEGLIAANATAAESTALTEAKQRADKADQAVRDLQTSFESAVRARVVLHVQARSQLGAAVRLDDMTERQIHELVIKRLDSSANVSGENDDQVRGRFNTLLALADRNKASQDEVAKILGRNDQRNDHGGQPTESYEDIEKGQWKKTLSNGRKAAEGR